MNQAAREAKRSVHLALLFVGFALLVASALGTPSAPQVTIISNETSNATGTGTLVSETGHTGGRIITMNLDAVQQNIHWKAYAGNVTGSYILEDASGYSIYQWAASSVTGEVYATRVDSVGWTTLQCANVMNVKWEEQDFNHSAANNPDDRINVTFFESINHRQFSVGDLAFAADQCNYSIRTYVNDTAQTGTAFFDEIMLYDGNTNNSVYVSLIENSQWGYRNDSRRYDYQILVPENASLGLAATATPFYFYAELT